jgi:hypothetical protein
MTSRPAKGKATKPPAIQCPHCGIDRNTRGAPFNEGTLLLHIRKRHPEQLAAEQEAKPENALSCGICGAWKSRRGEIFLTEEAVRRHMGIAHRGETLPATELPDATSNGHRKSTRARAPLAPTSVKFCPQCGCNLEVVAAALSFVH